MPKTLPQPGDIILTKIKGLTGAAVWLMQLINGDASRWTHVAMYVGDGMLFEAQPAGAQIVPASVYEGRPVRVIRRVLTDGQRLRAVALAQELDGAPYNWSTYFYLAAYRLRLPLSTKFFKPRAANPKRMICSQAVDWIMMEVDEHLFDDGRLPHDVTPGDMRSLGVVVDVVL